MSLFGLQWRSRNHLISPNSVCNTVVSGPVEHVRIRLQTQPTANPLYAGPVDCVRKLYAANGLRGVFKGQLATVWRDGVGYGWDSSRLCVKVARLLGPRQVLLCGVRVPRTGPLQAE